MPMHEVVPHVLWIGHALDAKSARAVAETGIAAVVDLAMEEQPAKLPRDLVYCRIPLVDGAGNAPEVLRLAVHTVVALLESRTPTLVTCSAGMSRAPVVAALALAIHRKQSPEETLRELAQTVPHDVSMSLWQEAIGVTSG